MPDAAPPAPMTTSHYTANLRQQVIAQLATGSIPAAATEGRMYADTTLNRYVFDTGSALLPGEPWAASGRVGLVVSRVATQSIPTGTGTFTAISYDTEATDTESAFTPHATTGTTYTVPTNRGGLWAVAATASWASSPGANSTIEILVGATAYRFPIGAATQILVCAATATLALAAADAVQVRLSQGSGGAINVTAALQMWRLSA